MTLQFSPASPEDIEPLYALNRELIEQYEDLTSIDLPAVLAWVRRKLEKKHSEYRTVWLDHRKVGYFRLCEGEDGTLELDDLYVFPEYRRHGIAASILEYCFSEADRTEKPLMLYVFLQNHPAVRLYEKAGFTLYATVSPTQQIMIRQPHHS